MRVDRTFQIIVGMGLSNTDLNTANHEESITLDEMIPIDFRIKRIHRIYHTDAEIVTGDPLIQSTISPLSFQDQVIDGVTPVHEVVSVVDFFNAMAFYLPNEMDVDFMKIYQYFDEDTIQIDSRFVNMIVKSDDYLKVTLRVEKLGATITTGAVYVIHILECETL